MKPVDVTHFDGPEAFGAWLSAHHDDTDSLWVGYWKKHTGRPSMTWEESVDEALCYGWIDGIRQRIDDEAYTIRFTPRRPGSTWSLRNVVRYEALEAEGRIRPAGRAAWERRREAKTGTYSFEQRTPPKLTPDMRARLRVDPAVWAAWQARPPGYRKKATHWLTQAKREATRERRLLAVIEDLGSSSSGS
ncbi:MAG: bacteriocin-protection protein [Gemmatimonadetes bacterium]|nr:bacteriocin-protection protein [Gemmatimonadota bacterium]